MHVNTATGYPTGMLYTEGDCSEADALYRRGYWIESEGDALYRRVVPRRPPAEIARPPAVAGSDGLDKI